MTSPQPFAVPTEAVEAGLLNAGINNMGNWLEVATFDSDSFSAHRNVYLFIVQYLQQYGTLPSGSTLSSRFSNWNPPVGDFRYWLVEMKRYQLAKHVMDTIKEGYDKIADPEAALSMMLNKLSVIRSSQSNHIQAADADAMHRLETFDYRTENYFKGHRMIGLRTGLKVIDDTMIGYTPGSLVGAYARPGVGKTWWLLWSGLLTWQDGGTVLVVAPEMPASELNLRIDTLAAAALGRPIEYNKLRNGDPSVREDYAWLTGIMSRESRWWTYDSLNDKKIGVGEIAALIRQHQPTQVLIDGISLLRSDTRGSTWEQIKDMVYDLKNLATIYETNIIITHQANRGIVKRGISDGDLSGKGDDWLMPSLNDAAYGDAFVQACSDVITFVGERTSPNVNWYRLAKHRERGWQNPLPSRMGLAVDFAHGKIIDVSDLGYSTENVIKESRRLLGI